MERKVRISDIAGELGLSTATVSNVIHGKTTKVSDETVKRVQALLEEREYIPSMAGILLAQNSSKIIGVFLNDHEKYEGRTLEDPFIASSLNCLSAEIEKRGQFMMVQKAKDPIEIIRFASMWNMDGLVVIGFCTQDYNYLREHMRLPFVVYDGFCKTPERFCNITLDNYGGGFQVGDYFRQTGHEKALCVSDNNIDMDWERYQGFQAGLGGGELLVVPMEAQQRREFYLEHLTILRGVSAIFAVSDYYAIDLMRFLHSQGIRVPEDVSVAGFDDIPLCQQVWPTLTTVRQDGALRAKIAMEKLELLKDGQETAATVTLSVKLVVRESTR